MNKEMTAVEKELQDKVAAFIEVIFKDYNPKEASAEEKEAMINFPIRTMITLAQAMGGAASVATGEDDDGKVEVLGVVLGMSTWVKETIQLLAAATGAELEKND